MKFICFLVVIFSISNIKVIVTQDFADNELTIQPEFDRINITEYLLNEHLLKFQLKCLLFDGPCDIIGRWLKPRVKSALLGECASCTDIQKRYLETWMGILTDYFPEIHRAAVAKYIAGQGITVSDDDQELIQKINSDDGWREFSDRLKKVIKDIQDGKIKIPTMSNNNS